MALTLVIMRTFSNLLVVTFMAQKGLAESGIVRPLSLCLRGMCYLEGELYICLLIRNLAALTC
jgi:hypothetical protein